MATATELERAPAAVDRTAVEDFLIHEADLLDRRDYQAWLDLFTEDCLYWLPLEEGQASGYDTVSLIYDDRLLLETRIRRLSHPRMHAQAPHSRICHVIGNVKIAGGGIDADGLVTVRSNQMIVEYRQEQQRLFAGHCTHRLVPAGDGFRIKMKRLDLIDSEGPHRGIPIIL